MCGTSISSQNKLAEAEEEEHNCVSCIVRRSSPPPVCNPRQRRFWKKANIGCLGLIVSGPNGRSL